MSNGLFVGIHCIPEIFSKCPHEYPNIAYLGEAIVLSIRTKLPSV